MQQKQTHIAYGFVTGIIMVVISLVIYLLGMSFKPGVSYIPYIPFIIGVILNGMAFSKANDSYVTFGNVFGSCFKTSMIVTIVILFWSVLSMYLFPEMKDKAIEMSHTELAKNPKMTDEQIDMSLNIMKKYWNVLLIAGAIFGTLFFGVIFSLIGGAIAKKNGPKPFQAEAGAY